MLLILSGWDTPGHTGRNHNAGLMQLKMTLFKSCLYKLKTVLVPICRSDRGISAFMNGFGVYGGFWFVGRTSANPTKV
jgi:hypothetical protein